ncbi:MAG: 2-dehydropantoate 2-reductase [Chloroflexi bacterium]|nr:2-dehydropantoate 2-reductase [Chloroflexota bacterium]MDA1145175.1 2-dehydropantoate 2-reductase [Chloroflexota bacterium]
MSRVAVIGAGAVGCYYGARLAEAGHDVHFLLRSDYDAVAAGGLHIESVDGAIDLDTPSIARSSAEIGPVDWVLCALKATAMDAARDLVAPCVGPETRILALMNGLGIEEQFATWFPDTPVFGGLAFTCINRGAPGHIQHIDYGPVTLGHLGDDAAEIGRALDLWSAAKVEVPTAPSLLAARWQKLCWNVPFNGLTVTCGGVTTDVVMGDRELRASAERLMRELCAAGNADLEVHGVAARLDADAVVESMMTRTDAMAAYRPSTMIDFLEGREMEIDAIFEAPLRRASELGVPTPLLAMIAGQMLVLGRPRK